MTVSKTADAGAAKPARPSRQENGEEVGESATLQLGELSELLGYSLKPFGAREPLGQLLFSLIDNAGVVVIEYPPQLERATSQVPSIVSRPRLSVHPPHTPHP